MKKSLNRLFVSLFALFAVLFVAGEAAAQRRVIVRPRPVVVVKREPAVKRNVVNTQKAKVDVIIKRVEENTDDFVGLFDKSLDKSGLNGTNREDYLNKRAHDLESATDELRREFDRRDSWAENKDEVRKCLNIASDINGTMRNRKLGAATEAKWVRVRNELNNLAAAYNLPKVGSGAYK
ncbi:MAG: hypothetical protein ACR2MG_16875 [Pyrinomonadaceae bacterium]